jgi:hypothetical protein
MKVQNEGYRVRVILVIDSGTNFEKRDRVKGNSEEHIYMLKNDVFL